jgi:hypothetical protein
MDGKMDGWKITSKWTTREIGSSMDTWIDRGKDR